MDIMDRLEQMEEYIIEELEGAEKYAKLYCDMIDIDSSSAKEFKTMAMQELDHAEMLCKLTEHLELDEAMMMAHKILKKRNYKEIARVKEMLE